MRGIRLSVRFDLGFDYLTGEIINERKFRKTEFDSVMEDDEWKEAVDTMLNSALVKVMTSNDHVDIDPEAYEEIKALSEELDFDEK